MKGSAAADTWTWEDLARRCKEEWVRREACPDMPPVAIAEREGRAVAMVVAPRVERDLGLIACARLRAGFDADLVAFISDGYGALDLDPDRPWPPGHLQSRFEAGDPAVTEALFCVTATRSARWMVAIHYSMRGGRVEWMGQPRQSEAPQGNVPECLARILAQSALAEHPDVLESARQLGFDAERSRFHTGRSALALLAGGGFLVYDLVTGLHPEWVS